MYLKNKYIRIGIILLFLGNIAYGNNIKRCTLIDENNNTLEQCEYDSLGNLIKEIYWSGNGFAGIEATTTYYYEGENNTRIEKRFSGDVFISENRYDEFGNIIQSISFKSNNSNVDTVKLIYNNTLSENKVVVATLIQENSQDTLYIIENEYDAQGRLVYSANSKVNSENKVVNERIYMYNENSDIKEYRENNFVKDSQILIKKEYSVEGDLVKEEHYKNAVLIKQVEYIYENRLKKKRLTHDVVKSLTSEARYVYEKWE